MYTGTNKTALASQKQIADSFVTLLKETPYNSISVSLICKVANVSRQTFYSLFESKENIILYELSEKYTYHPGEVCQKKKMSLQDLSHEYADFIISKKEFLSLLVANDIMYLMRECLFNSFTCCTCCFQPSEEDDITHIFVADFFASGLSSIAKIYITHGQHMKPGELEALIYELFNGELFE